MVVGGVNYEIGDRVRIYSRHDDSCMYDRRDPDVKSKNIWYIEYTVLGFGRNYVRLQHPAGYSTCMHTNDVIRYRDPPGKKRNMSGHLINTW